MKRLRFLFLIMLCIAITTGVITASNGIKGQAAEKPAKPVISLAVGEDDTSIKIIISCYGFTSKIL